MLFQDEAVDADGSQRLFVFRADLMLVRISGHIHMGEGVARVTTALGDWIQRARHATVFMDLEGFSRYDSEVRVRYTNACLADRDRLNALLIYADSPIVRMGVSVASIAIPQLRSMSRSRFHNALAEALAT